MSYYTYSQPQEVHQSKIPYNHQRPASSISELLDEFFESMRDFSSCLDDGVNRRIDNTILVRKQDRNQGRTGLEYLDVWRWRGMISSLLLENAESCGACLTLS